MHSALYTYIPATLLQPALPLEARIIKSLSRRFTIRSERAQRDFIRPLRSLEIAPRILDGRMLHTVGGAREPASHPLWGVKRDLGSLGGSGCARCGQRRSNSDREIYPLSGLGRKLSPEILSALRRRDYTPLGVSPFSLSFFGFLHSSFNIFILFFLSLGRPDAYRASLTLAGVSFAHYRLS